jgi:hypothetical protein
VDTYLAGPDADIVAGQAISTNGVSRAAPTAS